MGKEAVKSPKVFISYAWSNKDFVIKLANRLMADGIDTIIDAWYLKQGNDKYAFMESMVRDKTIDHVLIICDKAYKEKADNRTGGVGDETVIITPQLYGEMDQTKFVPIVLENDDEGNPCKPIYIDSRIHFDLSHEDTYENEYESLLRFLYNEPYYLKPKLGSKPEWLKKDAVNVSSLINFVNILKSASNETRKNAVIIEFYLEFSKKAKEFSINIQNSDVETLGKELTEKINAMKPLRDVYLDFLKEIILSEKNISDFVCTFFENVYNKIMLVPKEAKNRDERFYEHYSFLIWESFICTVAYLRYYGKYAEIYSVLTHTYYLQAELSPTKRIVPSNIREFGSYCRFFDGYGKKMFNLLSFTADTAIKRPKEPLITKKTFAETDVFLCQMSFALQINYEGYYWFPVTYIYLDNMESVWIRLSSRQFCEKILPLFGVNTIDELKKKIQDNQVEDEYKFPSVWKSVPKIPIKIQGYEIASLP